ncbi:ABC transporter permease [Paenibacillus sp. HJL G12]|uniref:ABC transporter permease n=1 Tax=Paenibacillus dendrobii TaxID=2691084 RepID=A0A7X3IKB9_9BACL|nr:ABC transporter permease [Paenibacillus dendrobii]MWV45552.1 ABC transporter permease [Paenibacillus dendrobii]
MKRLLKVKFAWFPVWSTAVLMLCMICVYLPVFSGSTQKLTDFPLIVVNEDQGISSMNMGQKIMDNLVEKQNGHSFKWTIESSKEKALEDIKNNKAYGAIVIPSDYSASLVQLQKTLMTGETEGKPVKLEVLLNEGGGQMATSVASNALGAVSASVSNGISKGIKESMMKQGLQVSPQSTSLLDAPVQATTANVLGLPANVNKGMTPFVMVLISSITGLMGANMIHGYLGKIAEGMARKGHPLSSAKLLVTELLMGIILAVLVTSALLTFVFGVFGSAHTASIWRIYLFMLLCCLTMYFLFKMISIFLGKWGMLAMFPLNILGIFASGGAIPLTTLPEFHRIFSSFLPTRYMVDGMRALFYYHGHMQAGLGTALKYIVTYFIMFLFVCAAMVMMAHNKDKQSKNGQSSDSRQSSPNGQEMGMLAAE